MVAVADCPGPIYVRRKIAVLVVVVSTDCISQYGLSVCPFVSTLTVDVPNL